MRKILLPVICAMGLGLSAVKADALTINIDAGDPLYVGQIIDGIPSSEALEATYINNLIDLAAGAPNTVIGTETYNRIGSLVNCTLCPDALAATAVKVDAPMSSTGLNVTGWTYILAKYDASNPGAGSFVWFLNGTQTLVDLPATANGYGLSHYTLFNFTSVPDGGATVGLLGLAMLGVGYLRRRLA